MGSLSDMFGWNHGVKDKRGLSGEVKPTFETRHNGGGEEWRNNLRGGKEQEHLAECRAPSGAYSTTA